MLLFLSNTTRLILESLVQLGGGCVVCLVLSWTGALERLGVFSMKGPAFRVVSPVVAAVAGLVLPFGIFGALPIASAALAAGIGGELVASFVCSNLIYNSLVPFTDPTFIWRTGYGRVVLGAAAGTIAAFLVSRASVPGRSLFRERPLLGTAGKPGIAAAVGFAASTFRDVWFFIVLGATAQTAFRGYGLGALMNFMFTNPVTAPVPLFFAQANVTNPFFLLAFRLTTTLTDFTALAALFLILTRRGLIAYFAYFTALTAILGATVFF